MSVPIKVERGIYIDSGCSGIHQISEGYFIPTGYQSNLMEKEFQKDLEAFLEKWFKPCRADMAAVEHILSSIPPTDVLGRMSFESRKRKIQDELDALDNRAG